MLLSKPELVRMLRGVAEIWTEHKDELSEIDSRFGDGDHGVTIGKIAAVIGRDLDGWQDDDAETFLEDLGDDIMAVGGGSAGPLYGTMIGGLAGGIPLRADAPWDGGNPLPHLEPHRRRPLYRHDGRPRAGGHRARQTRIPQSRRQRQGPHRESDD